MLPDRKNTFDKNSCNDYFYKKDNNYISVCFSVGIVSFIYIYEQPTYYFSDFCKAYYLSQLYI